MRYAITIDQMTIDELKAVTEFLEARGATSATPANGKGRAAVAELAAAAGASPTINELAARTVALTTPAPPQVPTPPVPAAPPAPAGAQVPDPFVSAPSVPAPVVTPSAPVPAATASSGDFDSRGVPHNLQFHADSKRRNNDGSWARRKGVNKDAANAWDTQHADSSRSSAGAPATPQAPTPAAPPAPPVVAPPAPTADQINAAFAPGLPPQGATIPAPAAGDPFAAPVVAAPPAPPAPVAPVAPVAPPAPARDVTYPEWHAMYTNLLTAGKITPEQYADISDRYGATEEATKFYTDAAARNASYAEFERFAAA